VTVFIVGIHGQQSIVESVDSFLRDCYKNEMIQINTKGSP